MNIFEATEKGDIKEIRKLIDAGVDINIKNKDDYTALLYAVKEKHYGHL